MKLTSVLSICAVAAVAAFAQPARADEFNVLANVNQSVYDSAQRINGKVAGATFSAINLGNDAVVNATATGPVSNPYYYSTFQVPTWTSANANVNQTITGLDQVAKVTGNSFGAVSVTIANVANLAAVNLGAAPGASTPVIVPPPVPTAP